MYGAAVGTPCYMPPEQAAGKLDELDFRTDVYALGTLLYELLSNQRPYASSAPQSGQEIIRKVLAGPPLPIRELNRKSTPELVAIAQKAMQRDKPSRYDSASDLAEELRAFLSQRVVTAYRTGFATRLKKLIARNQSLTIAGMLTLVSIIGALIVIMTMQYYNRNEMVKKNNELTSIVRAKDIANTNAVIAQNESNGLSLMSHSRKLREAGNATLYVSDIQKKALDYESFCDVPTRMTGNFVSVEEFPFIERPGHLPLTIGRLSRADPEKYPEDFPASPSARCW